MATVSSDQYTNARSAGHGLGGNVKAWWGKYTYAAAPSANDLLNLFELPKNSLALFGFMATDDIDTGVETLEIDVGFTANGGSTATLTTFDGVTWTNYNGGAADAAGFINSGVLTGDAVATDLLPAGSNWRPIIMPTGPRFFSEKTLVQAKVVAAAATGGTGTVYCVIFGVLF